MSKYITVKWPPALPDVKMAGFSPHGAFWFRAVPMACVEIVSSYTRASKLRGFKDEVQTEGGKMFVCLSVCFASWLRIQDL